ncbi:PREDICTED: suppression of tumorigenicity 5 protein-like [Priapulus caudatus]|uniref:Suppression of tumorigenicity 5 protein-like n=1 Tax=Priapulus caudatus TaxID=37621 RepID=A0ABM1E748_PRICU|nr:PREDICTED: suppression of tumorigenicity 5 protein-like [Priapulus caudatus]
MSVATRIKRYNSDPAATGNVDGRPVPTPRPQKYSRSPTRSCVKAGTTTDASSSPDVRAVLLRRSSKESTEMRRSAESGNAAESPPDYDRRMTKSLDDDSAERRTSEDSRRMTQSLGDDSMIARPPEDGRCESPSPDDCSVGSQSPREGKDARPSPDAGVEGRPRSGSIQERRKLFEGGEPAMERPAPNGRESAASRANSAANGQGVPVASADREAGWDSRAGVRRRPPRPAPPRTARAAPPRKPPRTFAHDVDAMKNGGCGAAARPSDTEGMSPKPQPVTTEPRDARTNPLKPRRVSTGPSMTTRPADVRTGVTRRPTQDADGGTRATRRPPRDANNGVARRPTPDTDGGTGAVLRPTRDAGNGAARQPARDADGGAARQPAQDADGGAVRRPTRDAGNGVARPPARDTDGGAVRRPTRDAGNGAARQPARDADGGTRPATLTRPPVLPPKPVIMRSVERRSNKLARSPRVKPAKGEGRKPIVSSKPVFVTYEDTTVPLSTLQKAPGVTAVPPPVVRETPVAVTTPTAKAKTPPQRPPPPRLRPRRYNGGGAGYERRHKMQQCSEAEPDADYAEPVPGGAAVSHLMETGTVPAYASLTLPRTSPAGGPDSDTRLCNDDSGAPYRYNTETSGERPMRRSSSCEVIYDDLAPPGGGLPRSETPEHDLLGYCLPAERETPTSAPGGHQWRRTKSARPNKHPPRPPPAPPMVRQKLRQAFSHEDLADLAEDTPMQDDSTGESSDAETSARVLRERIRYVRSVRDKCRERPAPPHHYEHLFEAVICVSVDADAGGATYEPRMRYCFPRDAANVDQIPLFCFPDARVSAFSLYSAILEAAQRQHALSEAAAAAFLRAAYRRSYPGPGESVTVRCGGGGGAPPSHVETFARPTDTRLEHVDYGRLLRRLDTGALLRAFSAILMERRVLFVASRLSTLSACVDAIAALLYPFTWQHTFVPVLPSKLLDFVCSPTPYVIGILSENLPLLSSLPLSEVLLVNLDTGELSWQQGDEGSIIPRKLFKALSTALNMCQEDMRHNTKNVMISEAFMRLFVEVVGHYHHHIRIKNDGHRFLEKESFVGGVNSRSIRIFLQWFCETQMFEVFARERMQIAERQAGHVAGLFEVRLAEHELEMYSKRGSSIKSNVRGLGKKVKGLGNKVKKAITNLDGYPEDDFLQYTL